MLIIIIINYFSETSIASARASVMIYDDNSKKWIPSGSSSGLSKVHIFKHVINNTFRVVGRKLQDHEVTFMFKVVCLILKINVYISLIVYSVDDNQNILYMSIVFENAIVIIVYWGIMNNIISFSFAF